MTDTTQNKSVAHMTDKDTASDQTNMLIKKMKETWQKLSDADFKLYTTQSDQFFTRLKTIYHIEKAEAEKRISEFRKMVEATWESNKPKTIEKSTTAA